MTAFADLVRAGKVLYIGVSEWRADEIAAGAALGRDLGVQLISNQPQYSRMELSPANYRDWKAQSTSFASMAASRPISGLSQ